MNPKLSKSRIGMYVTCPKSDWFAHIKKVPPKTDYPRLTGVMVHRFVAGMYRGKTYPLRYENLGKATNAWFRTWKTALERNRHLIRFPNPEQEKNYGITGCVCTVNYWKQNLKKPRPLEIEKRYEIPLSSGFRFVGVFDQVRKAEIEVIQKIRPELVVDGKLREGYDPVFIVDHKTGYGTWDLTRYEPGASLLEKAVFQFELHSDIQVTAYWWLYQQTHGAMPAGFYWYNLREGEYTFTYRTEEDYKTLFEILDFVMSGLMAEQFPERSGPHCKRCDFLEVCNATKKGRPMLYSKPSKSIGEKDNSETIEPNVVVKKDKQLSFNLKIPRNVKVEPTDGSEEGSKESTELQAEAIKPQPEGWNESPTVITLPSLDDEEGGSNDPLSA